MSSSNSRAIEAVIDGRTSEIAAQEVVRRRGSEPGGERALERGLRSLARGELDVGRGEELRPLGELADVDRRRR